MPEEQSAWDGMKVSTTSPMIFFLTLWHLVILFWLDTALSTGRYTFGLWPRHGLHMNVGSSCASGVVSDQMLCSLPQSETSVSWFITPVLGNCAREKAAPETAEPWLAWRVSAWQQQDTFIKCHHVITEITSLLQQAKAQNIIIGGCRRLAELSLDPTLTDSFRPKMLESFTSYHHLPFRCCLWAGGELQTPHSWGATLGTPHCAWGDARPPGWLVHPTTPQMATGWTVPLGMHIFSEPQHTSNRGRPL